MSESDATTVLARAITRAGSRQTYLTARLLVDRGLVDDCCRAYAYLRWADDVIDANIPGGDPAGARGERIAFIRRQKAIVDRLYQGERPEGLEPEEELVAVLIANDQHRSRRLESYLRNFLDVLEFDAFRRGRRINQVELTRYSNGLARAVTDGIQHFIGCGHPYPLTGDRHLAVRAAHITHMLRDMAPDLQEGYINIPCEYLDAHCGAPVDLNNPSIQAWVRSQVELARSYLRRGKRYLETLDVLRCKIAGYWYCARYEGVLDAIERDGYALRAEYGARRPGWVRIVWLAGCVTVRHLFQRVLRGFKGALSGARSKPVVNKPQKST